MILTLIGDSPGQAEPLLWVVAAALCITAALVVAAAATGKIRPSRDRLRRSGRRAAISLDAAFAPKGRQDALEHLLDDRQVTVVEQPRGDGDVDGETSAVLFQYSDDAGAEPDAPD